MKKKTLYSILLLGATLGANAAYITPEEALQRVKTEGGRHAKSQLASPHLLNTFNDREGEAAVYVFTYSGDEGFMILSADDSTMPLIGYSETNPFVANDMPEHIQSWMSQYVDQIGEARKQGLTDIKWKKHESTRADEKKAVSPLVTSNWDQGSPYNLLCPTISGRRSVTGCVATAMAQVMNYWEYPLQGKNSISYSPESTEETLDLDFSEITFDWDNMLDKYGRNYTEAQSNAVATLMMACGYSVKMSYSPGSSGAYSRDIANALKTYFGYDQGTGRFERSNYKEDEWDKMIYGELAIGCPVIYDGQSSQGAHCFVCDGYDGEGLYHINWGWGGLSDGYFLLGELTPSAVGTGGHYGGYNMNQDAIIGIMPPVGRLVGTELSVDNKTADSGNVSGMGYIYRINDFNNIRLSATVTIAGGHVSSPLYITVLQTDPTTLKNEGTVVESTFDEPLNASEGTKICTTRLKIPKYDVSKLYTINVAYELKGEKKTIGSVKIGASAGINDLTEEGTAIIRDGSLLKAENADIELYNTGGIAVRRGKNTVELSGLPGGLYIAIARDSQGITRILKLHL